MLNCPRCNAYDADKSWCKLLLRSVPGDCPYAQPKPMTNADSIRAMNDEGLARFIAHYDSITEVGEQLAYERWLDWLRMEV